MVYGSKNANVDQNYGDGTKTQEEIHYIKTSRLQGM
jgi:hypothetical protein